MIATMRVNIHILKTKTSQLTSAAITVTMISLTSAIGYMKRARDGRRDRRVEGGEREIDSLFCLR